MDIINYGVNTPQNFNPNVVRGMLNNSEGSGSSSELPYPFNQLFIVQHQIEGDQIKTGSHGGRLLDKTFAEIQEAYDNGVTVARIRTLLDSEEIYPVTILNYVSPWEGNNEVSFYKNTWSYRCESEDDYPEEDMG